MDSRHVQVFSASAVPDAGEYAIAMNGLRLETPEGNPVVVAGEELADAIVAELLDDEAVDVTRPSLYAFYSVQRDFIEPDPERTIAALVELLAHDYVVHPDARLARRQVQVGAWAAQIELWRSIAGHEPPYADPDAEPDIRRADYGAFHAHLDRRTPAQLSVAIHGANVLKSVTLGILLAEQRVSPDEAIKAMRATARLLGGDTPQDMDEAEEQEEGWREVIQRLLNYARLSAAPL